MRLIPRRSFCLAAWLLSSVAALAQQFALHDGDTVIFYGDSITAQQLYTKNVEEFVLTRYPQMNVHFINAGVPGDTVYGGYAGAMADRVKQDVAPFHPTQITVMLGMNDGGYVPLTAKIDDAFLNGYKTLLDTLHAAAPDASFTIITPTPYDEVTHGTDFPGYSGVIDHLSTEVAQIASSLEQKTRKHVTLVDFHGPLLDALHKANRQFPELAPLMIPDRIHPSETGHWIMTAALLSGWHVDPTVTRVAIDAASGQTVAAQRTSIDKLVKLQKQNSGLRWTQLDSALPLPLDLDNAMTKVLLGTSNIESLDQETLRVDSLQPGTYKLTIDAKPIASFTSEQLKQGINLALFKTPMLDQARGIDWYEQRRATLDQARFILRAEVQNTGTSSVAEDRLQQAEEELAATIRAKLVPTPHTFELDMQTAP